MSFYNDIIPVHGSVKYGVAYLPEKRNPKVKELHKNKSFADINGEYCVKSISKSIDFWMCNGDSHLSTTIDLLDREKFDGEPNELKNVIVSLNNELDKSQSVILSLKQKLVNFEKESPEDVGYIECRDNYNKSEIKEMLVQIECKDDVIDGLKEKIRQQHCDIQDYIMTNMNLENSITALNSELDIIRKSESWFKREYHISQENKQNLQKRIIILENSLLKEKSIFNKLNNSLQVIVNNFKKNKDQALREKENMIRQIMLLQTIEDKDEIDIAKTYNSLDKIDDLSNNSNTIYLQKTDALNNSKKDYADLSLTLNDALRKLLQCEITIQSYSETNSILYNRIGVLDNQLKEMKKDKFTNIELRLELDNCKKDKTIIDGIVKKLKLDFDVISERYFNIKNKLTLKNLYFKEFECEVSYKMSTLQNELESIKSQNEDYSIKIDELSNELNLCNEINLVKEEEIDKLKIKNCSLLENKVELNVQHQTCGRLLRVLEGEHKEKVKRFELYTRTLLKKIKELRIDRKIVERHSRNAEISKKDAELLKIDIERLQNTNIHLQKLNNGLNTCVYSMLHIQVSLGLV